MLKSVRIKVMIRKIIQESVKKSISNLQKEGIFDKFEVVPQISRSPKDSNFGDYSTNVSLEISKLIKENPIKVAQRITDNLNVDIYSKVEIASPGFINFYIKEEIFKKELQRILKEKEKFGNLNQKKERIQVEFISANPTGPLHVGNSRGGPFGDVLANILKKAGFYVEKAYYLNDYGSQIETLGHSVLKDEKAKYAGEYIEELRKELKPFLNIDAYKLGKEASKIILKKIIRKSVKDLKIKYDEWFSESDLYKKGKVDKAIKRLEDKGLTYQKEGALWFKSKDFSDNRDRVLVKSNKEKTYLAGDIAYHLYKFEDKKFDTAINIWGADHMGDIDGLMSAMEALGHKNKLQIILLQFVTLFEGKQKMKMSKRKGTYITLDYLLEKVPADVVRFFFLSKSSNTHLNFDIKLAMEQSSKNPIYYVQYAYARICSILRKTKSKEEFKSSFCEEELNLAKDLLRLEEVIEDCANDYQIHRITQYSLDLASSFHKFYKNCKVLCEDKRTEKARIGLVKATEIVLKNTLDLMGISSPCKM